MTQLSKDQLTDLVSRVADSIAKETPSGAGRAFGPTELKTSVGDLGRLQDAAWEISYKTSAVGLGAAVRPDSAAWEISYKTSSVVLDQGALKR